MVERNIKVLKKKKNWPAFLQKLIAKPSSMYQHYQEPEKEQGGIAWIQDIPSKDFLHCRIDNIKLNSSYVEK